MQLGKNDVAEHNATLEKEHARKFEFVSKDIVEIDEVVRKLTEFQIAIPSWALGTGGTRFGRFPGAPP